MYFIALSKIWEDAQIASNLKNVTNLVFDFLYQRKQVSDNVKKNSSSLLFF